MATTPLHPFTLSPGAIATGNSGQLSAAPSWGQLPGHLEAWNLLDAPIECASCHSTENVVIDPHYSDTPFCTDCLERAVASEADEDAGGGD